MGASGDAKLNTTKYKPARRSKGKQFAVLAWNAVPAAVLGLFIQLLDDGGRAVLLGRTTSGDVLSVIVYDDGEREKFYIRNTKEVPEELANILEYYSESASEAFREALGARNAAQPTPTPFTSKKASQAV